MCMSTLNEDLDSDKQNDVQLVYSCTYMQIYVDAHNTHEYGHQCKCKPIVIHVCERCELLCLCGLKNKNVHMKVGKH